LEVFRRGAGGAQRRRGSAPKLQGRKGHELGADEIIPALLRRPIGEVQKTHEGGGRLGLPRRRLELRKLGQGVLVASQRPLAIDPGAFEKLAEIPRLVLKHRHQEVGRGQLAVILAQG